MNLFLISNSYFSVTSGSNVKFMFDFGDGSPITVPGENISGVIKGNVSYIFKQGEYSIVMSNN